MRRWNKATLLMKMIFFFTILENAAFLQDFRKPQIDWNPKIYICYRTDETIIVDGSLKENSWHNAVWTDYFVDIEGNIKPKPFLKSRVKMLWDSEYFYIAAELEEPHIWATLRNRDDIIFYDNDFEVFIDPDGDTHRYIELEINAFNTVWDLFLIKPYRDTEKAALHGYDIKGLKSGVKVYGTTNTPDDIDSCWTVEIAFPWEAFKEVTTANVPPEEGDQWRVNFSRVEWRIEIKEKTYKKAINPLTGRPYPEYNWVWSPQGVINMHYPEMWGFVHFTKNVIGSKITPVQIKDIEYAKWSLREIYYAQRDYYKKFGTYANKLSKLNIKLKKVDGYIFPPKLIAGDNFYFVYLYSTDKKTKLILKEDGLISRH